MPHPIPDRPWSKLGADIFDFENRDYLILVDYFSKYPEVARLENKTATGVIQALRPIFARHGIPDTLISDNMPFASYKMRQFAQDWGFEIVTSSPTYPQSNGQSEKFVGTVKSLFRKAKQDGRDPNLALLDYRNTPISGMEFSPAQLLMNRRLRDKIPTTSNILKPKICPNSQQKLKQRQARHKFVYDKRARPHKQHQVGDNVRLRRGKVWNPAVITGKHHTPRSYYVTTEDGQTYRRNQRFINPSSDQVHIMPAFDIPADIPERLPDPLPPPEGATPPPEGAIPPPEGATPPPEGATPPPEGATPPRSCTRSRTAPQWHKDYKM